MTALAAPRRGDGGLQRGRIVSAPSTPLGYVYDGREQPGQDDRRRTIPTRHVKQWDLAASERRRRPEDAIQRAVFQHLRARAAPNVFAFHPANGGYRKPIEAAILKGMGVVAGVPDVLAIHEGRVYALELKAEGGRATPKQLEAIAAMEAAGAFTAIAEGLDRALAILEAWGLLRGRVS
jgi:hypothetical protein